MAKTSLGRSRICVGTATPEPKCNAYDAETRKKALEIYYSGVSGRQVGKLLGMSKANVYAVVAVFVEAYNAFNRERARWKERHPKGEFPFGVANYF